MPNWDGVILSPDFWGAHTHARSGNPYTPSTPGKLPESDRTTLTPQYLLGHENHFDPNVVTPENLIQGGILEGRQPVKTA